MALMVSYSIDNTANPLLLRALIPMISRFIFDVSVFYWSDTVDSTINDINADRKQALTVEEFKGTHAPDAVVFVKTSPLSTL